MSTVAVSPKTGQQDSNSTKLPVALVYDLHGVADSKTVEKVLDHTLPKLLRKHWYVQSLARTCLFAVADLLDIGKGVAETRSEVKKSELQLNESTIKSMKYGRDKGADLFSLTASKHPGPILDALAKEGIKFKDSLIAYTPKNKIEALEGLMTMYHSVMHFDDGFRETAAFVGRWGLRNDISIFVANDHNSWGRSAVGKLTNIVSDEKSYKAVIDYAFLKAEKLMRS